MSGPGAGEVAPQTAELVRVARSLDRFAFTASRPVAVLMVFLAVVVFGAFSLRRLPVTLMPEISYPKLTVRTEYPGAAPAEVEHNVARPLEEILGVVAGLTRIESISRAGQADVVLEFAWDTDMDQANQDVLEKIDAVKPALPEQVKQPLLLRYDPALDPVMTLSLGGEGDRYAGEDGLKLLRRIGEREVRRILEPTPGVAAVKVKGGLEEEVDIELDEDQLRRTNIDIATVVTRLQAENINVAGGTMREGRTRYLVRTVNEFRTLDELRELAIVARQDRVVRLRDIARVVPGYKDRDVLTRVDGAEAVEIELYKEADANIVDMAARVRDRIRATLAPKLDKEYGARVHVVSDRSRFIEASIAEVRGTAVLGGLLAVAVLFVFLRDLRSTAIVAVAIPVSILATFAPLGTSDVSLNVMSLGGLALGVGMLVDNSIVVIESIYRCREEGDDLIRAAVRGTAEVGGAVFASTMTTVAVFFPMVFVQGVAGQMFADLGVTVVYSLLASLAVALFLVPMLASRAPVSATGTLATSLKGTLRAWAAPGDLAAGFRRARRVGRVLWAPYLSIRFVLHLAFELVGKIVLVVVLAAAAGAAWIVGRVAWIVALATRPLIAVLAAAIAALERAYLPVLRAALRRPVVVYVVTIVAAVSAVRGFDALDTELIPELHQGEFTAELSLPVGTPLEQTKEVVEPLEREILAEVEDLQSLAVTIGSPRDAVDSSERGEHTARMRVTLAAVDDAGKLVEPPPETKHMPPGFRPPVEHTVERMQDPQGREDDALAIVRRIVADVPDLLLHVSRPVLFSFKAPVEIEVRGYDLEVLARATSAVAERMEAIAGLRDVKASIRAGNPEIQIVYDREALTRYGLDVRQVAERIRDKVQGNEATQFRRLERKIPVRVRIEGIRSASVQELRELVINPGAARPVPLSAVAEIKVGRGPNEIRRIGQQRVGLVTANLEGVALGGVAERIRGELRAAEGEFESVTAQLAGQTAEWEDSSRSLYFALALSVFLVYVIMAAQFESLIHPFVILMTIPLAAIGVVGALWALDMPMSVVVFLGVIVLVGIVVNNAIVLVDYVNQLRARGHDLDGALELAGSVRLRPILMTTLTTVLGLVPMAMGVGDGAEIRTPLAITVISGLSLSTLLTLVVIPTLYRTVERLPWRRPVPLAARLGGDLAQVDPRQLVPDTEEAAATATGPQQEPR